ncbi:serine hydrolase domain-containing protein [Tenacibaculum agarivorans]|uniref:serine hydrolase domain-containing protein n=1 Tax=Tenacibaculum agarivorans TaxID=1908389 RepID=UPI00094BB78D|nr:serine hydrolase domain-containing protein [Tenacibaculum agarivorans]
MKKIFALILLVITLISCGQDASNTEIPLTVTQQIDSLFSEFDNLNSPGYAIGISKNGKTLYKKGYGAANLDYNIPITPNSAFSIASVSKQFTAACIALLILENKISLETPASNYIPELKKYADTIRIKHLIYNTSGITDYHQLKRKGGKSWVTFNYFDIDECISTSLAEDKLQFTPGDKWDYCNINFMLLTKIVEKISGMSFSEFSRTKLFEPLEMKNTLINDDITQIIKNRVTPYNFRIKEYLDGYNEYGIKLKEEGKYIQHPRNSPHYGGSGVVTTIEDLLKWSANMTSKRFGGQEFYDLMHKTLKFKHEKDNQAFGLYIGNFNGRKIVAWDGGDWGISSQLLRFPDQGIAIVVLSNIGSGQAFRKVNGIADILVREGLIK